MRNQGIRKRISDILQAEDSGDLVTRIVNFGLLALIAANGVALVLETVEPIRSSAPRAFALFERVSVYVFSLEYVLRLWSCTAMKRFRGAVAGRVRFVFSPMAMVDLLAILPFYLPAFGIDLRSARLLRLFRIFRMVKLARYSKSLQVFARIAHTKKEELLTVMAFLAIMLVVASTLLYYAEHRAQPDVFSSIPASMWWAIATLTTVGYGDMYPVTDIGRVLGAVIAVLGIGLFALPAGILGSAFMEELRTDDPGSYCPHCGKSLE